MDLAFVFLAVVIGVGVIVYAGMRNPKTKQDSGSGDSGSSGAFGRDNDQSDAADGGGDGGGGGD